MIRYYLLLTLYYITGLSLSVYSQQNMVTVTGKVIGMEQTAIADVTVRAMQTTGSVRTGADGIFSIRAAAGDSILFSCVGYLSKKVAVELLKLNGQVQMDKAAVQMDEVLINTGYQLLKPNEINGSVALIDRQALDKQTDPNILRRIDGMANGVLFQVGKSNRNPQNKTGITIRGYSTINGPLDPLIVLDNFVYEGDIENINPDDIESVSILKDAEATSIYGARGGNGVIVLTSKRGKFDQALKLNATVTTTFTDIPDLYALPWMRNDDYISVEELLYDNGYFNTDLTRNTAPPITPIVYALSQKSKGMLSENDYQDYKRFLGNVDFRKQYSDVFYKLGRTDQYYLGLEGGSAKTAWTIAGGYNRTQDNLDRIISKKNLKASNTIRVSNRLEVSLIGQYVDQDATENLNADYSTLARVGSRQTVPYMYLYDENQNQVPFYNSYNKNLLDTVGQGLLKDWNFYPIEDGQFTTRGVKKTELLGNIGFVLKLIPGLNLQTDFQMQSQQTEKNNHYGSDSYYVRNYVNRFSSINQNTGQVKYNFPDGDILETGSSILNSKGLRSQVNFNKKIKSHHFLRAMLGFEAREVRTNAHNAAYFGYNQDPLAYKEVDFVNTFRTWPLGNISSIGPAPSMDPTVVNRFISMYGNFSYTFRDKYTFSGNLRKDGSNIYGVSTNDKWKPLWSIGLGYDLLKEKLFSNLPFSNLRLKTTWGYSGNVDLSRSALPIAVYLSNAVNVGGLPYARITTLNNPSLRWEQIRQFNVGADFTLKSIPLSGSVEYYNKRGDDLYGPSDYDYTTWGVSGTITKNVASMKGQGIDAQLRYTMQKGKFAWMPQLIFNYNTDKTVKYYDDSNIAGIYKLIGTTGKIITPLEGYPLYAVAGFIWKGLDDKGDPQGWKDGAISRDYSSIMNASMSEGSEAGSIRYLGSAVPVYFGSFIHEFGYANWTVSFNMRYKLGYYFRKSSIGYTGLVNNGIGHADYSKRWQQPGDHTDVPAFEYPLVTPNRDDFYLGSEIHLKKADHVRLQYLNIGYRFQNNRKNQLWKSASLNINASNLGILWRANKDGIDPDYVESISPSKQLSLGIKLML